MAEMNTSSGNHKEGPGVKKSKKLSTRIDLTPMVDLGFLLITFFIFTTTLSQPTAMRLFLPKDTGDDTPVKASGALTLLLGKNDIVYYYEGQLLPDVSNFKATTYMGIRNIIIRKKKSVNANDLVIVIKPQKESIYKNTVDALDEMTINNIMRYAVVDISPVEEAVIKNIEKGFVK